MGKELIEQSPLFENVLRKCDEVLARLPEPPSWSIMKEISNCHDISNVYKSLYSQPLCTSLQLGLVILLRSWGISPVAVVGHSSGEIAAAYTAGLVSLEDAIIIAYYRGRFLDCITSNDSQKPKGSMCAVGMSRSDALRALEPYGGRVQLAAANSLSSCTLSGDTDAIKEIERQCVKNSIFCRRLRVDMGQLYAPLYFTRLIH
jgi:acyl transferase domain-containing protein